MRWDPVYRHWFPEGTNDTVDWVWRFFQYIFPIPDPRSLRVATIHDWSEEDGARLARYVSHARDLANTTLLTARRGYSVSMATLDAAPVVNELVSPPDTTVGFLAMFRQAYSPSEEASFSKIWKLLAREARRSDGDAATLQAWHRAHGQLRSYHVDHLALVQAANDGHVPKHKADSNAFHPDSIGSPEMLLSTVFSGGTIHWGRTRSVIEQWDQEHPALAAKRRFDPIRVAVQLAHLYIGFASVVALSTGQASPEEL